MLKLNYTYLIQPAELHKQGYVSHVEFYTIKNIADAYDLKNKIDSGKYVVIDCQPASEHSIITQSRLNLLLEGSGYKKLLLYTHKLDLGNLTITL